ncbi:MAG TPA: hypothetical protein VEL76_41985 [Gemmataceae bacterium]|nr:hypothetical protein [Gemmataceae bacterium]
MTTELEPVCAAEAIVYGPDPLWLEGRTGWRYWVHHPCRISDNPEVDERLSGYAVAVFQPPGRRAEQTPMVIGLQGMAAPYQLNGFLIPTLLDMGIACVLFEMPCAGERSLIRTYAGEVLHELLAFTERGIPITTALILQLFELVARDCGTVLRLIEERHGLTDERRALFGVSLGTLLSAFAFLRDGIGIRLLGTIGHADLPHFARSYAPWFRPLLGWVPEDLLGAYGAMVFGAQLAVKLSFCRVLHELTTDSGLARLANPLSYLDRAGAGRRVRFLVGRDDPLVKPIDALACARRFPDGECYVVPGLGHGGDGFVDHVRYFLATQVGDWRW